MKATIVSETIPVSFLKLCYFYCEKRDVTGKRLSGNMNAVVFFHNSGRASSSRAQWNAAAPGGEQSQTPSDSLDSSRARQGFVLSVGITPSLYIGGSAWQAKKSPSLHLECVFLLSVACVTTTDSMAMLKWQTCKLLCQDALQSYCHCVSGTRLGGIRRT